MDKHKITGLCDSEVIESRKLHGTNTMDKKKRKSFVSSFLANFGDPMLRILLLALGIQIVFVFNSGQWIETFGIAIAIFVAVTVATISEYGSESAFEKLQETASAVSVRVMRNGEVVTIPSTEVVVGDIVMIGTGEKIPADGIVIEGNIEVDQSLLNGESKECKKIPCKGNSMKFTERNVNSLDLATYRIGVERCSLVDYLNPNIVFGGTVVTGGEAKVLVAAVGIKSEYGKIASELQEDTRSSPLKIKLQKLAGVISIIGYIGAGLVAVSYFFNLLLVQNNFDLALAGENLRDWEFMFTHILRAATLVVSVIVMAVPEGLPMMITVVLSGNMKHMLRDNVLVRKLNGIETAGSMNILFTDKTGTLTHGKLQVVSMISSSGIMIDHDKIIKNKKLAGHVGTILRYNNQSVMSKDQEGKLRATGGNSTDRMLLEFSQQFATAGGIEISDQIPFSSKTKFMSTKLGDGRTLLKGAGEVLLPRIKRRLKSDGSVTGFDNASQRKVESKMKELANSAHRLIVLAEDDILVGVIAIRDEVRVESITAVAQLRTAKIQTIMITGDAKETATAVAREVGILKGDAGEIVLTSNELSKLSDNEIAKMLPNIFVIARALPSDKSRLVKIAGSLDLVVGMTGDGVNDAPALKRADIGFAMGSGTSVAKEAGDIVILDDNISSISKAVSYGRTIFKSIRKFIIFKLAINFSAITVSVLAPLFNIDTPITVIQMLWINLVMDTLAGLAFGGEKPRDEYMNQAPKKRSEGIINKYMWGQIVLTGIFTAVMSLLFLTSGYLGILRETRGTAYTMTMFFAFFMMINIFNAFNARSHDTNIFRHISKNKPFIWIMGAVTVVQLTMVFLGGAIFRTVPIDFVHLCIVMLLGLSVFPLDLLRKSFVNKKYKIPPHEAT